MSIHRCCNFIFLLAIFILLSACDGKDDEGPVNKPVLQLASAAVGDYNLNLTDLSKNNSAPVDKPIVINFSAALNTGSVQPAIKLTKKNSGEQVPLIFSFLDNDKTVAAQPSENLDANNEYELNVSGTLSGAKGETFPGYVLSFTTLAEQLLIQSLEVEGNEILNRSIVTDVPLSQAKFKMQFSKPLDGSTVSNETFRVYQKGTLVPTSIEVADNQVTLSVNETLDDLTRYQVWVSDEVKGTEGEFFQTFTKDFHTQSDPTPDFPVISDDELLTLVQQQTFKYFYDFAHPASGMARERNTSGDVVTTGGTGFGIMALIVGVERNFITRQQGLDRFEKILSFLENADRFHGAWSHWVNGNTGAVYPFSANDNGGDLVETSFLVQGLLTFRQYLDAGITEENELIDRINVLWQSVEWDWYTKQENVLYWHWSPDKEWIMNHQIKGYNEALITYVLAASSPTHTIDKEVYTEGWGSNGGIVNGRDYYDIVLPVGYDYGGPLFFAHYSFMGMDPRKLSDAYANYWTQNVNHSRIHHAYAVDNPKNWVGYSDENWGLTASDNQNGYSAHSPTNDLGVIAPTAALSSFPYTPVESMKALKFYYYSVGDRLWGPYGFYDAFNLTEGWVASSYLAIDQGPIIVMIENHRTGLLWDLFMSAPEVQEGLTKLSFMY